MRPDSVKDTLSDSRKATNSRHTITVDMSATTVFSAGESFGLTFGSNFTLPALSASDISFDDGTSRTVLATCVAGANNIGLAVAGQVVTLSACAGFTSSAAGASVTIVVGTGSTLVSNPATSGIASLTVAGSYGDDSRTIAVAIIEGVTVSLTIPLPNGDVRFTGDVFPGAIVSILDGGMVAGTTVANAASFFDKTIQGLLPGLHTFGVFGQSLDGRRTLTLSFTINVVAGSTVTVSGILLPPVISVPASEKRPVALIESGLARHNSTVTTFTNSHNQISQQVSTNSNGEWSVSIGDVLHLGGHTASALVNDGNGNQSVLTDAKSFEVMLSADLNIDNLVSLTDFSMLMFNYGTSNPANKAADINDNGPVDLVDFSVMMFYWTGG
ncbi:MAG: hypothetical protein HZB70_04015 [Candidatus Berkelbacteria bacterium]|nr:MAG: hypothetical protein HZB70_04015 [Candidatus Berkelbacteria bacterium]QQG51534.1 MAG: hypothetical protein HY845_03175 [Candidatus Berkelbacteria bacterium]